MNGFNKLHRTIPAIIVTVLASIATSAFAADTTSMSAAVPVATTTTYRFELAGPVQSLGGKSIVPVRLIHVTDSKPVVGAIIIESRADMGPIGMASMTAPIKPLGEQPAGTYRFEVANGSVWKKPDNWSLSFDAKVQGVTQTVSGSVTVKLAP
jgi:hypothetical protein